MTTPSAPDLDTVSRRFAAGRLSRRQVLGFFLVGTGGFMLGDLFSAVPARADGFCPMTSPMLGPTCDPVTSYSQLATCPQPRQATIPSYNGCGPSGGPTYSPKAPFAKFLTPCCNDHDCCYGTCGASKSQCDEAFLHCMLQNCQKSSFPGDCVEDVAIAFYEIVKHKGTKPYQSAQVEACACCQCPGQQELCGGACVDTNTDPDNCGSCGHQCQSGVCLDGVCQSVCPEGTELCFAACVDTGTDAQNCGACGVACPSGQMCCEGTCTDGCKNNVGAASCWCNEGSRNDGYEYCPGNQVCNGCDEPCGTLCSDIPQLIVPKVCGDPAP